MDKTKVDDILIEMIKPKIEEIEKKFSSNQPLSQDDINTLLLKSQYNHINHLDLKLNETTQSVKNLEHKFELTTRELRSDFMEFKQQITSDFKELEQKFQNLDQKIETTIQKALNKNMMLLIVVIGFFMTLSKIIDKF